MSRLSSQLFVARLPSFMTSEGLKMMFARFDVTKARLVRDPETRRPRGFGFVTFKSEDEAAKAQKFMNGRIVDGKLITVEAVKHERHRPRRKTAKAEPHQKDTDF